MEYNKGSPGRVLNRTKTAAMSSCPGFASHHKVKLVIIIGLMALGVNYVVFVRYWGVSPKLLSVGEENTSPVTNQPELAPASGDNNVPLSGVKEGGSNPLMAVKKDNTVGVGGVPNTGPADKQPNVAGSNPYGSNPAIVNSEKNANGVSGNDIKGVSGKNGNDVSEKNANGVSEKTVNELPKCPEKPANLVGAIRTYLNHVKLADVEKKYPEVTIGGHYTPKDCKPTQKMALIIPCRNRDMHLSVLLNNIVGLFMKQKLDFTIFVIDQDFPTTFNRGMLFNVGYLEALKRGDFDCFVFSDVDMIPANDMCLYRCTSNPRHFLAGVSKWNYGLPYKGYYGGVVSFTKEQYRRINGDSNLYFGWGGEDDDLRMRVLNKGYSLVRYPKMIGRYDTISHRRDSGNKDNPVRFKLVEQAKLRQDVEGLSTTKYKVTEITEKPLFTKIKVFINMTEIIQTTPAAQLPFVLGLVNDAKRFDEEVLKQQKTVAVSGTGKINTTQPSVKT